MHIHISVDELIKQVPDDLVASVIRVQVVRREHRRHLRVGKVEETVRVKVKHRDGVECANLLDGVDELIQIVALGISVRAGRSRVAIVVVAAVQRRNEHYRTSGTVLPDCQNEVVKRPGESFRVRNRADGGSGNICGRRYRDIRKKRPDRLAIVGKVVGSAEHDDQVAPGQVGGGCPCDKPCGR